MPFQICQIPRKVILFIFTIWDIEARLLYINSFNSLHCSKLNIYKFHFWRTVCKTKQNKILIIATAESLGANWWLTLWNKNWNWWLTLWNKKWNWWLTLWNKKWNWWLTSWNKKWNWWLTLWNIKWNWWLTLWKKVELMIDFME